MNNIIEIDFSELNSFSSLSFNKESLANTINYLSNKNKVLILATSNRWEGGDYEPAKSTQLAQFVTKKLGSKASFIDVSKLHIEICEGNVSTNLGNRCGLKDASLKDKDKNPSGYHRCWASINNQDDELWKISKELFQSDAVLFFTSIRWGQTNSIYQKLIERLDWIENRHTTLGEDNIVKNIDAGIIAIGQNWNGKNVINTESQVLKYFGFKTPSELAWNWQYTSNDLDESQESYKAAVESFDKTFLT
jgi:multimeric flavodoxin WrbA